MTDFFFICLIESSCCSRMEIEKTNSLSIFLPLFFGSQIRVISLPVGYKTAQDGGLGTRTLLSRVSVFLLCEGRKYGAAVYCVRL